LEETVAAPVYKVENTCYTLYPLKSAITSPASGGRSVGIVRSRTKATGFSLVYYIMGSRSALESTQLPTQ
jgi:hypothetical protein